MPVLLQVAEPAPLPGGYGVALLQTLLALAAVCILAWVVLRWGARRGLGVGGTGGAVRVIERVALDPRRALYVVQVGERVLLLGTGDGAAPALLTELDPGALPARAEPRGAGALFRDAFRRARGSRWQTAAAAARRTGGDDGTAPPQERARGDSARADQAGVDAPRTSAGRRAPHAPRPTADAREDAT
jgi:flagellar biosynthetic protein FliO